MLYLLGWKSRLPRVQEEISGVIWQICDTSQIDFTMRNAAFLVVFAVAVTVVVAEPQFFRNFFGGGNNSGRRPNNRPQRPQQRPNSFRQGPNSIENWFLLNND